MDGKALRTLLNFLKEKYADTFKNRLYSLESQTAFYTLVATIISQNTTWRNARRALENLKKICNINPEEIVALDYEEIAEAIRVAGLQEGKAKAIKEAAKRVLEEFEGDLSRLAYKGLEDSRKWLMNIPGVGPKTADVLLAFSFKKLILPVDTHIKRIARRLGITSSNSYDAVRSKLEELIPPEDRLFAHIALIMFGREYCRAINPRCKDCPIRENCPSKIR